MDSIGQLELNWIQGFKGTRVDYITRDTVCFKCGNYVRFLGEDGHGTVYSPGEGVSVLAVHSSNKVFAVAEQTLQPKIYVVAYPSFRQIAELTDGAELEYTSLVFSASIYLATVSGVPDFQLTLWNYETGVKLCTFGIAPEPVSSIGFNPANWRELFISTDHQMAVWQIEQSSDKYTMQKKQIEVLPLAGVVRTEAIASVVSSRPNTRMTVDVPKSCIAGVRGHDAEKFEKYQDTVEKVAPVSHAWTPTGDIYVGCASGHLLKVAAEEYTVSYLYNPTLNPGRTDSSTTLQLGKQKSDVSEALREASTTSLKDGSTSRDGDGAPIGSGSVDCLALHKEGLYAAGEEGTLRKIEISKNGLKVAHTQPIGLPIKSLSFNPSYSKIVIGSSQGSIQVQDIVEQTEMTTLLETHHGQFAGADVLTPGTDVVVSVREDGEMQIWRMDNGKLLSSIPLCCQATTIAASPLAHVVAVGSSSGHVLYVDVNKLNEPRFIHREHVHNGPVRHLMYSYMGQYLLSGSDDGHIFVIDGRPSKKFHPIGHTAVPGVIEGLSIHTDDKTGVSKVAVTASPADATEPGATKLTHFDLPATIPDDLTLLHASLKCDLNNETIKKMTFNIRNPSHSIAVTKDNIAFTIGHKTKQMHKLNLPKEPPKKETSKDSYLEPLEAAVAHGLPGGRLVMSPHQKWVASIGTDGRLSVKGVGNLEQSVEVNAHDYREGGGHSLTFSADAHFLLTTGCDGTLACFKWRNASGAGKGHSAVETQRARMSALLSQQQVEDEALYGMAEFVMPPVSSRPESAVQKEDKEEMEKQKARENDLIYTTPTPTPSADATWLEIRELEAIKEEDKEYTEVKKTLRTEIRDMRRTIQNMMKENEGVPDIEKLGQEEFDLDVEEQNRMQAAGEQLVQKIREDKEFDNLSKMYLADLIRKECWEDMVVKGRGIQAFNSVLEVHNYPMRKRTPEEMAQLQIVSAQRRVEQEELNARRELTEAPPKSKVRVTDDEEANDHEEDEGKGKEKPSTTGSLGVHYGGGNELFYSQFELHSREQKMQQIVLLEDAIYRIKNGFNKEFDEVYHKKEQEVGKIKEKNKRIKKILEDLELDQTVFEPDLGELEKPELLLTVQDSEVKVEKFLTAEQKKEQEEQQKIEEERRLKEKGDNARDRALDMMMGGVLEIKKEDELKKDVPVPAFMSQKEETEWSEDEKKAAAEYERKVKELQEEREKYRKQLEAELKKLQTQIQESTQAYDEALQALHTRKIKTEMVIYQEELKIVRLKYSLLLEEELTNREAELADLLQFKMKMKTLAGEAVQESKKNVDAFRDYYEDLEAHERVMDREFKRKFNDCSALHVDQLYKLFRKRPRGQRGHIRAGASHSDTAMADIGATGGNPFADRPPTARRDENAKKALDVALAELDKESNMPEGVELHVWERLCTFRREKIEKENLVKQKAQVLAGMQEFLKHRQDELEQYKMDVETISDEITKLQDDRMRFTCNLEVQLMMKQGQVEVDSGSFIHSYLESLLLHRSVVEDLNGRIRQLGETKIASMVESKDFRKGIVQLEWEHKKMTMEMEDLRNKQRDIQNLKVTREIQAYLNEENHDAKTSQEIQTLEQTIQKQKEHHERNVSEKKKVIKDLKKTVKERTDENERLSRELQELNVSVNERKHIHEVNADKRSDAGRDKRYQEIVQRRKLVDLAKAQAQEVAVLRAEVERLRMRTFPALVQVEH